MNPIVNLAYGLESLLRTLSLAVDGQQIACKSLTDCGGGAVIDMAADMAGKLVEALELAEKRVTA